MSEPSSKKLILVIGATGAQGIAVIDALLAPSADGSSSPYAVRALTRDLEGRRALLLKEKGVELAKGSFEDFPSVFEALKGVYGVWSNTDGFTVGEKREVFAGMRIFELAKQIGTKSNYNPAYRCEHYDGKGRVADFMKAQPSIVSETEMSWSCVTTGPYMEMLNIQMFGPLARKADGTFVFKTPVGGGRVPMIALADLGWWARYTFDHRSATSGQDLEICSDQVGWEYLLTTFQNVTKQKAVVVYQSLEEWFDNFGNSDRPVANEEPEGTTWRENFRGFWGMWRDDVVERDVGWIRGVNPGTRGLEGWMRETGYMGGLRGDLLKDWEDTNRSAGIKAEP